MNWSNKRAILYRRVSTDDQKDHGYSLPDQEDRLQKFCELMHIQVVAAFEDDYSAKSFARPGWEKMFEFIRKNKGAANLLLFTNWSRFSRSENMGETYMMIDHLYKLGIEPQAIEQPLDLAIPENRLILAFYVASPMVENLRRSSNIKHGVRRALKQGRWCNNIPFGYKRGRDANDKPLMQINPETAPIIENIFKRYLDGQDPQLIIHRAREKGLKNYGHGTFRRIITNQLYAGIIKVNAFKDEPEQFVKGLHEPIISEDIFWAANRKWRGESSPKPKVYDVAMPLRGLLHCDHCGGLLTGGRSRGKYQHYWYYRCLRCNGENYSMQKAETELLKILSAISLQQKYIDYLVAKVEVELKSIINERLAESNTLKRDIKNLDDQITSLEQKYIGNKVSFETYEKYYPVYRSELAEKHLRLDAISINKDDLIELYRQALPKMQNLANLYQKCDLSVKHELLKLIFIGGLFKLKPGYRTPQLNALFSVESATAAGLIIGDSNVTLQNNLTVSVCSA